MLVPLHYRPMLDLVCQLETFCKFIMTQVRLFSSRYINDSMITILDDWDCVTTCFFIDTAHNIIEYVERLWKILKPGGVWINFGG